MITELIIQGLVQGVGFRPFIYLLAREMNIKGTVINRNNGVLIRADLSEKQRKELIERISTEHPPIASIHHIEIRELPESTDQYTRFSIAASCSESDEITQIAPDIAVCDDCLNDRISQPHRIGYPFVNCTRCGPRFSIIEDLPYDRIHTTMSSFAMCPECRKEYTDITDRRFHAQPVACNHCGPIYYMTYRQKIYTDYREIIAITSRMLNDGKIIAVKGIGGYHLACDATNNAAVKRLRRIKIRDTKPFAVMFKDIGHLLPYVFLNEKEKENLLSRRRPIVLLKQRKSPAPDINPGMRTLGCMLPYMPVHYDWFQYIDSPVLVMTSGNISDVPIAVMPEEAEQQLGGKVDLLLHHNRPIRNRVDDSVVQVCNNRTCVIRRSRGYAPEPFFPDTPVEGILAFGAEKTNTFALGRKNTVIQSQYIGDLKNEETFRFYTESLAQFQHLFRFAPRYLACDLHPDYLSTLQAEQSASKNGVPLLRVQHHHAHAVACMGEHRLNEPVLAVVWDGTGAGDDGKIWGGEFFRCDRKQYIRLSQLEYIPMPGGDKAALEPWRSAVACLHHYGLPFPPAFTARIGQEKIDIVTAMIDKEINTPYTSSAGRLFDAFASLIGICDTATRQAEAPVLLEQHADEKCMLRYPVNAGENPVSCRSVLEGILKDMQEDVASEIIAAKIHNSLADLIVLKIKQLIKQTGIGKVILSGGCFQNKRLAETIEQLISTEKSVSLYMPGQIPCNDGGIAVGQILVAAARNDLTSKQVDE